MEFAVNYSPEAAGLLADGRIAFDRFKLPDWPDLISEARPHAPVYVHFPLGAGGPTPEATDWDEVARLREETATPLVNLHLRPSGLRFPGMAPGTTDPADREAVAAALVADVSRACERFGADSVAVENTIYRGPAGTLPRPGVEPEVITAVVERTGCGLVLDLAHARITAPALGLDARGYLARLPLQRLRELHVTGVRTVDGRPQDHLPLTDADWELFDQALDDIRAGRWRRPWVVAFEYGGVGPAFRWRSDDGVLAEQVPRLAQAVGAS